MQTIQQHLRSFRNEIKGFAILWVVFFHARLGLEGSFLYEIQKIGYGGVDLFFFLSGFGLYHSLSRSADLGDYFRRRVLRILPAYWPFCLVWLAVMLPLSGVGMASAARTIAGNLFMVGYFSDAPVNLNWYLSAMLASLLLAPFLCSCLKEGKGYWKRAALLLIAAFALGLAFVDHKLYMAVSRLPVFILGMIFAKPCAKSVKGLAAGLGAAFVIGLSALLFCFDRFPELLASYALYWHPFVLITPALCAGLGWFFSKCPRFVLLPLRKLGEASFEIFLFNVWVEVLGKSYGLASGAKSWALWSLGSIAAGLAYHALVEYGWPKAERLFSEKSKKRA